MASKPSPALVTVRIGGAESLHEKRLTSLVELVDEIREGGDDAEMACRPLTGRGVYWYEIIGLFIGLRAAEAVVLGSKCPKAAHLRRADPWGTVHKLTV